MPVCVQLKSCLSINLIDDDMVNSSVVFVWGVVVVNNSFMFIFLDY